MLERRERKGVREVMHVTSQRDDCLYRSVITVYNPTVAGWRPASLLYNVTI